jgi:hypothetical protein
MPVAQQADAFGEQRAHPSDVGNRELVEDAAAI